ncbi:MAG TPA: ABC transporter permease [Bryobacteraceae bacterium]|jgi:ABC-2 type transport system permease protein
MSYRRTYAVMRKELLHITRDVGSLTLALLLPFVMLLLFGYALSLDVDQIPAIVYDHDGTLQSRDLIREFSGSRYFKIIGYTQSDRVIDHSIDQATALVGIVIPERFSQDMLSGRETKVQILLDGSDSNTASIALGYADALVRTYAAELRTKAQDKMGAPPVKPPVDARIRVMYNEDLQSRNFIVPGLIAVIIMIISALLTSLTIAREWEQGTMEQLLSTPVRPMELVFGKLSAYFVVGLFDMIACLVIAVTVFDVPMKGSVLLLFVTSCIFLFGALSWGVFISASVRSQLIAYQLGTLTSFLPAFMLSGFIYSIDNMPFVIQMLTRVFPARYFVTITKGIFLKGVGVQALWVEILLLIIYAAVVFVFASRKMRQKVA